MNTLKNLFSLRKRREEMKNFKEQCAELEAKVSDFIYDKSGKYHPIPRKDLTKKIAGTHLK